METQPNWSEPTGNTQGIDADALLQSIEQTGSAPSQTTQDQTSQNNSQVAPAQPNPMEFSFNRNGQVIKGSYQDPKTLQWISQGYDYAQRMQELKANQDKWAQEKTQLESQLNPYKEIDEFAKANPEWWGHIEQAYLARKQGEGAQGQASTSPELQAFKSQLDELRQFKTQFETYQAAQKRDQEDKALTSEIKSIRDSYPDLGWDVKDESGRSLEQRVLEHAVNNGINSYKLAFKDYYHDEFMKRAEERGKEQALKAQQKNTKLGLLGTTQAPTKGLNKAENLKSKSYNDLMNEALQELGIA